MSSYAAIYDIVQKIPHGHVATYGQVAQLAQLPGRARLVGYALFKVAPDSDIPWHRVINAKGEVSESPVRYGSDHLQRVLLEEEGVYFNSQGKINLRDYQWRANLADLLKDPERDSPPINSPDFDNPSTLGGQTA
jgi:methylated-DNA-protein-cysteine methyltransferase related protein